MNSVNLPQWLQPYKSSELVRVGKDYDGGYVISLKDINQSSHLITMGIQEDWSFEEQFSNLNNIPVDSYDFSVGLISWLKCIMRPFYRRFDIVTSFKNIAKPFRFYKFFTGNRKFYKKKIGISRPDCDLASVIGNLRNVYLKIDIEGSEYELLQQILELEHRLTGMAIEFHNLPENLDLLKKFYKNLNKLKIVHVHPNSVSGLTLSNEPKVLELSFSKNHKNEKVSVLPNQLDMPNSEQTQNIMVKFSHE